MNEYSNHEEKFSLQVLSPYIWGFPGGSVGKESAC